MLTLGKKDVIIIGHRNPDTDSIAASAALAQLKIAANHDPDTVYLPAAAGLPSVRTEYLFKKFNMPLPRVLSDVYPRVNDIISDKLPPVPHDESLFNALAVLNKFHVPRLPVVNAQQKYLGMLSLYSLLNDLLAVNNDNAQNGLTGRIVRSSLKLITEVLGATTLCSRAEQDKQDFEVYVAAMNVESFKEHIPRRNPDNLAIIVGDRADIHLMAINIKARLLIVTGSRKVDPVIIRAAAEGGVSIIQTSLDSATVVRRLKFSCPVELAMDVESNVYSGADRLADIRNKVLREHDDIFPVTGENGILCGVFSKLDLDNASGKSLILVDHNEFDQAIAGVEEVPVIEVVDHHRFGMPPTQTPIKINCDIVGSSCTLVTEMFIAAGIPPTKACSGILMGGIVTDTLLLRSPTSTVRDRMALDYLSGICGINPAELLDEIFKIGSLIAKSSPDEVLNADCKYFRTGDRFNFAIAQVEEVGFDEFYAHEAQLRHAADEMRRERDLNLFVLMITNVVRENSLLLAFGDNDILEALPYRKIADNLWDLPGILSRKKQLLPQVLKLFENL